MPLGSFCDKQTQVPLSLGFPLAGSGLGGQDRLGGGYSWLQYLGVF